MSSGKGTAAIAAASDSSAGPTQLMLSTPPPVLHLLTRSAPFLGTLTRAIRILTWRHPSVLAPWILLTVWWTLCLFGVQLARYGINGLAIAAIGYGWLVSRTRRTGPIQTPTMDSAQFAATLDDARALEQAVAEMREALDPIWAIITWREPHDSLDAGSYLLTSYPFVLALTAFVPLPYIFGWLGTLLLCWHAPWFRLIRRAMTKSLLGRWLGRLIVGILGGGRGLRRELARGSRGFTLFRNALTYTAAPPKSASAKGTSAPPSSAVTATNEKGGDLHYTFTVYENQRWWVGLDWTQALLPNERPSWSDSHNAPVSPPSTFLLPATTSTTAPSEKDPKTVNKRTTEWRWIDDWNVRLATTPVSPSSTSPSKANRASMIDWKSKLSGIAAGRRASETALPPPDFAASQAGEPNTEAVDHEASPASPTKHRFAGADVEWDCDEQGWQYGDNAWSPLSAKGKIGRYTRRRAWTRTAVVTERTEKDVSKTGITATPGTPSTKTAAPAAKAGEETLRRRSVGAATSTAKDVFD